MPELDQRYVKELKQLFSKNMGDTELEENFYFYLLALIGPAFADISAKDSTATIILDADIVKTRT